MIVQHVSQRLLTSQLGNAFNIHYNPNANANASNIYWIYIYITMFTFILVAIHSINLTLRSKQIPIIYHCIWEFGVGIFDDVGICVYFFHHCNISFSIENENLLKWWVILKGCQCFCGIFGFRHFQPTLKPFIVIQLTISVEIDFFKCVCSMRIEFAFKKNLAFDITSKLNACESTCSVQSIYRIFQSNKSSNKAKQSKANKTKTTTNELH